MDSKIRPEDFISYSAYDYCRKLEENNTGLLEALKYARSRIMLLEQFTDGKLDNSNLKLIDSAIKKATE